MMNTIFKVKDKLRGVYSRRSMQEEIVELARAQEAGSKVTTLMSYREWPVMERMLTDFQNQAVTGLAVKNISREEAQRLTNRLEQISDIRNKLTAKIKAGEVAMAKLKRLEEKENG